MRRAVLCALMISLIMLCGCSSGSGGQEEKKTVEEQLQEEYRTLTGGDMTAKLCYHGLKSEEHYVLTCHWSEDGKAQVEVVEPEFLAGIRADFDREALALTYEDVTLAAGTSAAAELSPAQVLPGLIHAVREGYITEINTEKRMGEACVRLLLNTAEGENPVDYAVWFSRGHAPLYFEVLEDGRVFFEGEITAFSAQAEPQKKE